MVRDPDQASGISMTNPVSVRFLNVFPVTEILGATPRSIAVTVAAENSELVIVISPTAPERAILVATAHEK